MAEIVAVLCDSIVLYVVHTADLLYSIFGLAPSSGVPSSTGSFASLAQTPFVHYLISINWIMNHPNKNTPLWLCSCTKIKSDE